MLTTARKRIVQLAAAWLAVLLMLGPVSIPPVAAGYCPVADASGC